MGTFRVSELAKVARSTSVEAFERLLGPLVLISPPELDNSEVRFRTMTGMAAASPLRALLEGVAHPVRKAHSRLGYRGGEEILIGRSEPNDIRLRYPTVSKFHAHIRFGTEGAELLDAGSTNGTFYDDAPVAEGDVVRLEDGHRVRLGDLPIDIYDPARLHSVLANFDIERFSRRRSG